MSESELKIKELLIAHGIAENKIEIHKQIKYSKKFPLKYIKIGKFEKMNDDVLKEFPMPIKEASFFDGSELDCFLYYINF